MILPTLISFVEIVFGILVILLFLLYFYFRKQYQYRKIKKVPYAKPVFPFGNMFEVITKSGYVAFKKLYKESKHQRCQGIWLMHKPVLMINDPDLIHQILIKNFPNFHTNGSYFDKDNDPFSETLFTLGGAKWKNLRTKLSPIFTSGKLKAMLPLLMKCSENLQDRLQGPARENQVVDATDFTLRFTADVVFSVIFGMDRNFLKSSHSIADEEEIKILQPNWILMFKFFFAAFIPEIAKTLKYGIVPRKSSDYLVNIFRQMVEYRQENGNTRNDVMQLLIQLLEKGYIEDVNHATEGPVTTPFHFQDLTSQAMTFLAGGFETTTKAFQFAFYELATNPEIQKKLKKEINEVLRKHNGQVSYEAISEMEYLSNVIDETLRKYSIVPVIARECTAEFKDVGSNLKIEKGEYVLIPIAGIHSDERYYPEPEKFDPERFTKENKASRPHCTYIPFGDGPRICIGQRFAQLEIRVGLVSLLSNFDFVTSEEHTQNPSKFEPKSVLTAPKGEMMMRISLSKS